MPIEDFPIITAFLESSKQEPFYQDLSEFFTKLDSYYFNSSAYKYGYGSNSLQWFNDEIILQNFGEFLKINPHCILQNINLNDIRIYDDLVQLAFGEKNFGTNIISKALLDNKMQLANLFAVDNDLYRDAAFVKMFYYKNPGITDEDITQLTSQTKADFLVGQYAQLLQEKIITIDNLKHSAYEILNEISNPASYKLLANKTLTFEQFQLNYQRKQKITNDELKNLVTSKPELFESLSNIQKGSAYIYVNKNAICLRFGGLENILKIPKEELNLAINQIAQDDNDPLQMQALIFLYAIEPSEENLSLLSQKLQNSQKIIARESNNLAELLPENLSTRIGFEVEFFGLPMSIINFLEDYLRKNNFTLTNDASISPDDNVTYGAEAITGIIGSKTELLKAVEIIQILRNLGARVNESCGLHVHLGVTNQLTKDGPEAHRKERFQGINISDAELQSKILKDFAKYYYLCVEPQFENLLRESNLFCKGIYFDGIEKHVEHLSEKLLSDNLTIDESTSIRHELEGLISKDKNDAENIHGYIENSILEKIENAETIEDLEKIINRQIGAPPRKPDRNFKLNLQSLAKHGTMEVRRHDGCVDPEQIARWVSLLDCIMDSAIEGTVAKLKMQANPAINELHKAEMAPRIEASFAADIKKSTKEFIKFVNDKPRETIMTGKAKTLQNPINSPALVVF